MSSGGCVRCAGKLGGRRREQSLLPIAAISLRKCRHTTAATLARSFGPASPLWTRTRPRNPGSVAPPA